VIYIGKADKSSKPTRVIGATSGSATSPALSHDRKFIMYSVNGGLNVVTISSRSFKKHSGGSGDTDVAWSPNDKQVAFAGHRDGDAAPKTDLELRLDGAFSGASQALTTNGDQDIEPCFFPDGKSIVWIQGSGVGADIWRINLASKETTRLTEDEFEDHEPVVSPDSKYIAFVSNRGGDGFQLYLMDLTTEAHEIFKLETGKTNVRHPSWSPKGRFLVFSAGDKGNEDLFYYYLNTQTPSTFVSGGNADSNPSWE
jgi:Tol biopolymer transport system component